MCGGGGVGGVGHVMLRAAARQAATQIGDFSLGASRSIEQGSAGRVVPRVLAAW